MALKLGAPQTHFMGVSQRGSQLEYNRWRNLALGPVETNYSQMNFHVAVTDHDWFRLHASRPTVDEVNFWRPSPDAGFKALDPGELLLFKLHAPRNYIAGGGFFTKFLQLPLSIAWEVFGEGNGVRSLEEMRVRIAKYRRNEISPKDNPNIGCIILAEPFFFAESEWISSPPDFSLNIVSGKGYDTNTPIGQNLYSAVTERLSQHAAATLEPGPATVAAVESARFGRPIPVYPRLGQGAFRVLITDAYNRRCAMTQERTLPVLEAAHIKRYSDGGKHELSNGLLLRSDLHKLFDQGYLTVMPGDHRIVVSSRIREEFENGRDYYHLHGRKIGVPNDPTLIPAEQNLLFHSEKVFR